ncbi:MAG TPA: RNA polymerase factor sigma-54 [Ktedonobacterales bacterium]
MSMDLNQLTQQVPIRVASPQLVAANHILALSSAELQALIQREVMENPAIEMEEVPVCQQCGRPLQGTYCVNCMSTDKQQQEKSTLDRDDFADDGSIWQQRTASSGDDEEFDPTTRVPAQMSLAEHLTISLQAQYGIEDAPIIEYLVGNLDDDGRLLCSVEEVVDLFDVKQESVERMIRSLQSMEPVGVGARDLRECLLIQLNYLESQGQHQPFAREVISRYLSQLSEHKYGHIALALGTNTETIHEVSEFIKRNLNPFPARGYLGNNLSSGGTSASSVLPDVIISKRLLADGAHAYDVEVVESKRFFLNINPSYAQLYAEMGSHQAALSENDRRHIQQYVSRAKLFISNINQRRQTLSKITRHIVDLQRDFLDRGVRALRPLTRARVALDLGMHESTVSRATAAKYVMLPTGEVIPFSNFFVANLGIKDLIKDLIDNEKTPLTDQELADMLCKREIPVARRTVAKYREQLGILPSTLR